jgi:hypothetical protein
LLLPFGGLGDGGGIAGVGYHDAATYVTREKWLESGLGVNVGALVPELKPHLIAVYFHEFHAKVSVGINYWSFLFVLSRWRNRILFFVG